MSDPNQTVVTIRNADGSQSSLPFNEFLANLRLAITAVEMTISCGEKFQKRQYEGKDYHSSMKFDLSALYRLVQAVEMSEQQVQARNAVAQIVRQQAIDSDTFQRETIRYLAQLDGIKSAAADVHDRRKNMGTESA